MRKKGFVFLAVVCEVLSRHLGLSFISRLWKEVIRVVRIYVFLTHGVCNQFEVRSYVPLLYAFLNFLSFSHKVKQSISNVVIKTKKI